MSRARTKHGSVAYFQNDHHPDSSVYLVNALVPRDRDIGVVGQIRDQRQQTARIEYDVKPQWTARVLLLVLGVAGLAGLTVARKAALI